MTTTSSCTLIDHPTDWNESTTTPTPAYGAGELPFLGCFLGGPCSAAFAVASRRACCSCASVTSKALDRLASRWFGNRSPPPYTRARPHRIAGVRDSNCPSQETLPAWDSIGPLRT